ncbi:MAG: glycosyltransferase family 4 protein [Methylocystis sp.]
MKIVLFANTDWYLYNFRLSLAAALRDAGHDVLLMSPCGPYGEKLRALGFKWTPAPMNRQSLNPLREIALLLWLWKVMHSERPDIVHGFTIKCAIYGALAARLVGAARVSAVVGMGYVFICDAPRARLLRPVVWALMRAAFAGRRARLILQNPDDVRLFLDANIVAPEQIRLIPGSGVDCLRFAPPSDTCVGNGTLRVVLAGRLLWDKGLAEFVEAARLLKAEGRQVEFVLAGLADKGNPASVSERIVREWQNEGLVEWLGHVSDMPALLGEADIVVLPSYREGLSRSLAEAAACAKPLIAADVPGCRDVVVHELTGLLVPVRDPRALARAIARLQDDRPFARRLGLAAREKALAEFDERIVIERTIAVYNELLTNGVGYEQRRGLLNRVRANLSI